MANRHVVVSVVISFAPDLVSLIREIIAAATPKPLDTAALEAGIAGGKLKSAEFQEVIDENQPK